MLTRLHSYKVAFAFLALVWVCCPSCKNKTGSSPAPVTPEVSKGKINSSKSKSVLVAEKAPIINLSDTIADKQLVLYVKDTASNSARISQKLATIYAFTVPDLIKKNKLKIIGAPIAWYRSHSAPFYFEAGLPIDKKPAKLPKGFFVRSIGGDSAIVAHFFGPYDITTVAYEALNEFFKSTKKQRSSPPYEIYVGDPFDKNGKRMDPYKVQTDIIFPYK